MSTLSPDTLFDYYQTRLNWISQRSEPATLRFYGESIDQWKHAKEVLFEMYQHIRSLLPNGVPSLLDCADYDLEKVKDLPPFKDYSGLQINNNPCEYPASGILHYRGSDYIIYTDDYGMQDFIVVQDHIIPVANFSGETDWYYELDCRLDHIYVI